MNKLNFTQYKFTWHGWKKEHYLLWNFGCKSVTCTPYLCPALSLVADDVSCLVPEEETLQTRLRSQNLSKCPNGGNFKCSISAHVRIPNCLFLKSISFCSFLSLCLPFKVWGVLNLYFGLNLTLFQDLCLCFTSYQTIKFSKKSLYWLIFDSKMRPYGHYFIDSP